jgi:predicted CoA-binding protein
MALRKDITFKGVTCNYHKIWAIYGEFAAVNPNSDEYTSINVKVALYKDINVRAENVENFLRLKEYRFIADEPNAPEKETVVKAYKALKHLPEFVDAVDV